MSEWRDSTQRAMRTNLDEARKDTSANDFLSQHLVGLCPKGAIFVNQVNTKFTNLRSDMALSNFGVRQGSVHVYLEKSGLWTARLSTAGTRTVAVFNNADIQNHLNALGVVGKDPKGFLKEIGAHGINEFIKAGYPIHYATVASGDMLWAPAHSLIMEQVGDNGDSFGLRWGMLFARDVQSFKLFKDVASSKLTPSTHHAKAIVAAVEAVEALSA